MSLKSLSGQWQAQALAVCALVLADGRPAHAQQAAPEQQVVVRARAQQVQRLADRTVYSVAGELQALTGNAADVLNTIPSVAVDADGNLSLRGDGKVIILVDGKPSAQLSGAGAGDGLLQMSASEIAKIEVMTTAPAEYRASGTGGVINIVTRKTRKPGASGSVQASLGNRDRGVLNVNGAKNTERLKLSGGFGLRQDDRQREVSARLQPGPASTDVPSDDLRIEHMRRLIPSLKGALEYRTDAGHALTLDANLRERSGNRSFDQYSQTPLQSSLRHSDGHEWSMSGDQRLGWRQDLGSHDTTLELALHRSTDQEREHYAYVRTALPATGEARRDHLYLDHNFVTQEFTLDYRAALAGERVLKLGYALQRDRNAYGNAGDDVDPASGQPVPNPDLTNQFRYRQSVQALYAAYDLPLGAWGASFGVRGERTATDGLQLTNGIHSAQQYEALYPSVHLERALPRGRTVWVGMSRRLSRPDPEELNPYVDHQDIHNLRAGNPYLLPQDTHTLEAGYRREQGEGSYGATAYIKRSRNAVTDITRWIAPDVLLSTKTNLPQIRAYGLEFNAAGPLGQALTYRVNGNLFHSQLDAAALGANGLASTSGLNLKASLDYKPRPRDMLQLSATRTDKRLTPQGEVAAINQVNLGYRHQWRPDLALVATVADLFNGQRFRRILDTPALDQEYSRHQLGRVAYLGVVYQFGVQKKASGFEFD